MTVLTARAPGKVNLSLLVGAPRPDGLHPLASVVQAVSLADELTLRPADGAEDEVVCAGVTGPNLAAAALRAFRETTGWNAPAQRLEIVKRVPVAAGMGGGSADAAAALRLAPPAARGAPPAPVPELASGRPQRTTYRPPRSSCARRSPRCSRTCSPPAPGPHSCPAPARPCSA